MRLEIEMFGYPAWRAMELERKEKEVFLNGGGQEAEWTMEKERRKAAKKKEKEKEMEKDKQEVRAGMQEWKVEMHML